MIPFAAELARWLEADKDGGAVLFLMDFLSIIGMGACLYALTWTRPPIRWRRYTALAVLVAAALAYNGFYHAVLMRLEPAPYPTGPVGSIRNGGAAVLFGYLAAMVLAVQMVRQGVCTSRRGAAA